MVLCKEKRICTWEFGECINSQTGHYLIDEGGEAFSEALKTNSTLTSLDLTCDDWFMHGNICI